MANHRGAGYLHEFGLVGVRRVDGRAKYAQRLLEVLRGVGPRLREGGASKLMRLPGTKRSEEHGEPCGSWGWRTIARLGESGTKAKTNTYRADEHCTRGFLALRVTC